MGAEHAIFFTDMAIFPTFEEPMFSLPLVSIYVSFEDLRRECN